MARIGRIQPRQRMTILGLGDGVDEAMEVTGQPTDWSISWSNDGYSGIGCPSAELRCTVYAPTVRSIKQPTFTLWGRLWQWLKDCPLRRTPHETAYPLL